MELLRDVRLGAKFDKNRYKLTTVLPFRHSDDRDDALERIQRIVSMKPTEGVKICIVDSGSENIISTELENICNEYNCNYIFLDTGYEMFSAGKARDVGSIYSNSEYLFFQDIDLIGDEQLYENLLQQIEVYKLNEENESFFMVPCVYLSEQGSKEFLEADIKTRSSVFMQYVYEGNRDYYDNFATGTSCIVVNRYHYLSIGGHDKDFFGHGFEDFELIHRLASTTNKYYKPFKYYNDFISWDYPRYEGFRSYFRLFGDMIAFKGIYLFHIWHGRSKVKTKYVTKNKDNKDLLIRKMKAFDTTRIHPSALPDIYRGKTLALGQENTAFYKSLWQIKPELGQIEYISENDIETTEEFLSIFNEDGFDRVIMPNPYGNEKRLDLYMACREYGIPYIVSDRGALNDAVFFDSNGFNADSKSYNEEYWNKDIDKEQEKKVLSYIKEQYLDDGALEEQGERVGRSRLAEKLGVKNKKVLFVPFQRPSDTVIKYFSGEVKDMDEFVKFVEELQGILPRNWVIVAKKHPLETVRPIAGINFVDDSTHIKDLIELSDAVLLINSGVGVQSMMWYKPVLHVGEAFYSIDGVNKKVKTPKEVKKCIKNLFNVDRVKVHKFINYLINDFYSFGEPRSEVVQRKDGSKFNVTREINFRKIVIPDCETRVYKRRKTPDVPFTAPIISRYKMYFDEVSEQKNKAKNTITAKPAEQRVTTKK